MLSTLLLLLSAPAQAGDGPWTLNPGDLSVYGGVNYFRYGRFIGATPDNDGGLGAGITAVGAVGVATAGLADGLELEAVVPYERVRVNNPASGPCTSDNAPPGFCRTTAGVGDLSVTLKGRLINELYTSPVTVSAAAGLRSGEFYADQRNRLTTLGDGQTDLGAGLSVGRTDLMLGGRGWYRVGAWGWYWLRFPNGRDDQDRRVPGDEISYTAEATFSLHPRFGFGPAVQGFHRLWGEELGSSSFQDIDVWSKLKAEQIQVGGKVGIYTEAGPTISIAALRTVYARNNPADTLVLSIGVGFYRPQGGTFLGR